MNNINETVTSINEGGNKEGNSKEEEGTMQSATEIKKVANTVKNPVVQGKFTTISSSINTI